jgi:hypothetical protein
MPRRDPKPPSEFTAGWGDLITLRCGVPRPAEDNNPLTNGGEMGDVSWSYSEQADGSARLTTTLRKAYVEVTLRGKYAHDASPLLKLAPAIKQTIPFGIA